MSKLVRFLTSVLALLLVIGGGWMLSEAVASVGVPDWATWLVATVYIIAVLAGYFALKRTKWGKYVWTLPDGITW